MISPPTPCLVLDEGALRRNIDRMARFAGERNLRLRPHAKTHKSRKIAELQAAAGAAGICCATIYEAECLAEAAPSILLTSPIAGESAVTRIAALVGKGVRLSMVADHPAILSALDAALPTDAELRLLVDVDPGMGRTGVGSAHDAVALARKIAQYPRLRFDGVQFYCGSEQHIRDYRARSDAIAARNIRLLETIEALRAAALPPPVITGGGTGTHAIDADAGLLTELQPGSYVFMDQDYGACEIGGAGPFELALTIHSTVVSANRPGWLTVDAGIKAIATDSGSPAIMSGACAGANYRFTGDEFGRLELSANSVTPPIGTRIAIATSHCDPTVNLHAAYRVIGEDGAFATWPVDARGYGAA